MNVEAVAVVRGSKMVAGTSMLAVGMDKSGNLGSYFETEPAGLGDVGWEKDREHTGLTSKCLTWMTGCLVVSFAESGERERDTVWMWAGEHQTFCFHQDEFEIPERCPRRVPGWPPVLRREVRNGRKHFRRHQQSR